MCIVCELAQRGNFQVEHVGPSTDQKLNQTCNCSSIKATCKVSIFSIKGNSIVQLKQFNCSIEDKNSLNKVGAQKKMICKSVYIYIYTE